MGSLNEKQSSERRKSARGPETSFDLVSVFYSLNVPLCLIDMEHNILTSNQAMVDFVAKGPEHIVGHSCCELVHGSDKPIADCPLERMKRTLKDEVAVIKVGDKFLEVCVQPLLDRDASLKGALHVIIDVTERTKADEALKKSEENYRQVVENAHDFICIAQDGMLKFLNQRMADALEYSKEHLMSRPFTEFIHPDDRQLVMRRHIDRLSGKNIPATYSFRVCHADGTHSWLELDAIVIDWEGRPATLNFLSDITERKKVEDERNELHRKAQERLNLIQRQNQQLIMLQKELKKYSRKLEVKVRKLEQERQVLTQKEKLVFWALTAYPELNDRQLSEKINIKRSTLTAVKNRLRSENMYSVVNIPDLQSLGCEYLSFILGEFNMRYAERKGYRDKMSIPEMVCLYTTDTEFFGLFAFEDMVKFHTEVDPLLSVGISKKILKGQLKIIHFMHSLSDVYSYFDFAPLLKQIFDIDRTVGCSTKKLVNHTRLTKNMKEILYALVRYPEASTTELARKLRLTRATVTNAKKTLFATGLLTRKIIPNVKKLNCEIMSFCRFKYALGTTRDSRRDIVERLRKECHGTVLDIVADRESVALRIFKDYPNYNISASRFTRTKLEHRVIDQDPEVVRFLIPKMRTMSVNFAGLTRRLLGIMTKI